jgi:hypothetical protein
MARRFFSAHTPQRKKGFLALQTPLPRLIRHLGRTLYNVEMDDITDTALGISAAVGIAICGICVVANAWRQSKIRAQMKPSRSNDDLSSMLEYVVPTGGRRPSPPSDPTGAPSEV